MPVNYRDGKIYKLHSLQNPDAPPYYGSTAQDHLSKRLSGHVKLHKRYQKGQTNFTSSFPILDAGDYQITLVEKYPCNSVDELRARERHYIENNVCVNKTIPGRTHKEWFRDNKEHIAAYKQRYRQQNSATLAAYQKTYQKLNAVKIAAQQSARVTCECGAVVNHSNLLRHKKTAQKHQKWVAEQPE